MRFSEMMCAARDGQRPPVLVASLPRNDPELARAALEGGAEVVKVHINVQHRASGTQFGNLQAERPALEEILAVCAGRPVGIVPGASAQLDGDEIDALAHMGFDFFSLYLQHAALEPLLRQPQVQRVLALSWQDAPELAGGLAALDVAVCELSIMHPETYATPFTYHDLARYAAVRARTEVPLLAPTQHLIPAAALGLLAAAGVAGVMVGALVAGQTPASWRETFARFRAAAGAM